MIKDNVRMVFGILTLIALTLGMTFAFFTAFMKAEDDIEVSSYKFGLVFEMENEFDTTGIIPMYDADVMTGYNNSCVDSLGNSSCQSYKITLTNNADKDTYSGIVNFSISGMKNLKYLVLDEDNNIYYDVASATDNTNLSLGEEFEMEKDDVKVFHLVIWLSDTGSIQNSDDESGSYGANITFESKNGAKLAGSILND